MSASASEHDFDLAVFYDDEEEEKKLSQSQTPAAGSEGMKMERPQEDLQKETQGSKETKDEGAALKVLLCNCSLTPLGAGVTRVRCSE